jgi:hypothetical protein
MLYFSILLVGQHTNNPPTHNKTPAPARTFKAVTTNKPKKTKQKQPCATQGHLNKTDGNPHNQIIQRQLQ